MQTLKKCALFLIWKVSCFELHTKLLHRKSFLHKQILAQNFLQAHYPKNDTLLLSGETKWYLIDDQVVAIGVR